MHLSTDLSCQQNEIRNYVSGEAIRPGKGGWRVRLRQEEHGRYGGMPLVEVEPHVSSGGSTDERAQLELTTAEVRVLAAQLLHLADREDLRRYDNHP